MARKTPIEMLSCVDLFEGLSRKELLAIERNARHVEFPAGATIVTQGEEGVGFHMILSGRAKIVVNGRTRDVIGPGKFFGELSLIDRGRRTATVKAETAVSTLSLASWQFMPLIEKNPSIARKILLELTRRLREERDLYTH
jgi:CRP/FNR family transcriptional regulator, cyclic AMP receptor protein